MRQIITAALILSGLALAAGASQAKPEYARKEMKACGYCHVNPAGGGPRNTKGAYYGMHEHSFKGLAPEYKSLWKMDVTAPAQRIAVGDLAGDKTPRLVLVTAEGKASVNKVGEGKLTEEGTVDLGKDAAKVVVGSYAKGKPAVIAVPGAIYFKDGEKYTRKDAKDLSDVTGDVRYTDGTENIFYFAGGQPDVWAVDLSAANPTTAGREMVLPDQGSGVYSVVTVHSTSDGLAQFGVPEQGQKAPVMGLVDARGSGDLFWFVTWSDNGSWTLRAVPLSALGPGANAGDSKPIWESPKLSGQILDVAFGPDPRGTKNTGIIVLSKGASGNQRQLEFFALD